MSRLRLLVLLAFAATPAFADEEPTAAQREAYIAAITANGCRMTEDEAKEQLPAAGLDKKTSAKITKALVSEGLIERNKDLKEVILKTEGCAP